MNRILELTLQRVVRSAYDNLGVPAGYPLPGAADGLVAVWRAVVTLMPEFWAPDHVFPKPGSVELPWADITARPLHRIWAVAATLADLLPPHRPPSKDWPSDPQEQRDRLLGPPPPSLPDRQLAADVVSQIAAFCTAHGVQDGTAILPSTERHHVRMYRTLLLATTSSPGADARDRLRAAKGIVERDWKGRRFRGGDRRSPLFTTAFLTAEIRRRPPWTPMGALRALGDPIHRTARRCLDSVRREIARPDPEDDEIQDDRAREPAVKASAAQEGRSFHSASLSHEASFLPTPAAQGGELGRADLLRIFAATASDARPEAAAIRTMGACLLGWDTVAQATIRASDGIGTIAIRVTPPHAPPADRTLLRTASRQLFRSAPCPVIQRIRPASRQHGWEELRRRTEEWLAAARPGATIAKIQHALEHRAPSWWALPWAVVHWGIHAADPKGPAPRSYCAVGADMADHVAEYVRTLFPEWPAWWDSGSSHSAIGSALVPRTEVVRMIASRIRDLADPYHSASAGERDWLATANTLASGIHWLFILLTGARNYPMPALGPGILDGDVEILHQKGRELVLWIPLVARPLLQALRRAWLDAIEHISDDTHFRLEAASLAWAYPREMTRGALRFLPPHPEQMAEGFLLDPILRDTAGLHPSAIRHWTNTVARELRAGTEAEIRAYHHHHPTHFRPLARHRLEPPPGAEWRERIAESLLTEAGLL